MRKVVASVCAASTFACASMSAVAADKIKIGFLSTLSGPVAFLGTDIRDAFTMAVKNNGGKLGGLPVEFIVVDDQLKPDHARQQAERLVNKERVDIVMGTTFSNIVLAVAPLIFESKTLYMANAGPSQLAGKQCNPLFLNLAWNTDSYLEAVGKYLTDRGVKQVVFIAPNYQAGQDAFAGFKRYYKGEIAREFWTALNQLDYSAELAQIRAVKPETVVYFLPGGMGINFVKQFVGAGLTKDIQLFAPGFVADQDIIQAVGPSMVGLFNAAHWAPDLANAQNQKFVAAFEKEYGRKPSIFASQGYDEAVLLDAAIRRVNGKVEDRKAFYAALRSVQWESVRGDFKFNKNGFPIHDFHLRVVSKDASGRLTNKSMGKIFEKHPDPYVAECKL
jgi:branched-chain amino acid transport system substrate-binding protein